MLDPDKRYVFIDGGYFRARRKEMFEPLFGKDGETDYSMLANALSCRKGFYYDCADERKPAEPTGDFEVRKARQMEEFNGIRQYPGFHVFQGTLSGERRQKEVDVALAVDVLMHAQAGNINEAFLVAGDLDFRPLVKALIQLGIYVTILCRRSSSLELQYAADHVNELTFSGVYGWSTQEFRRTHPIPETSLGGDATMPGWSTIDTGKTESGVAVLFHNGGTDFMLKAPVREGLLSAKFNNRDFLERYFRHVWGQLEWLT
jgi:uncharacterized LabA/DUF88 family protein